VLKNYVRKKNVKGKRMEINKVGRKKESMEKVNSTVAVSRWSIMMCWEE
jgi:hypothetical protein